MVATELSVELQSSACSCRVFAFRVFACRVFACRVFACRMQIRTQRKAERELSRVWRV